VTPIDTLVPYPGRRATQRPRNRSSVRVPFLHLPPLPSAPFLPSLPFLGLQQNLDGSDPNPPDDHPIRVRARPHRALCQLDPALHQDQAGGRHRAHPRSQVHQVHDPESGELRHSEEEAHSRQYPLLYGLRRGWEEGRRWANEDFGSASGMLIYLLRSAGLRHLFLDHKQPLGNYAQAQARRLHHPARPPFPSFPLLPVIPSRAYSNLSFVVLDI
jgi:hypothetical protein